MHRTGYRKLHFIRIALAIAVMFVSATVILLQFGYAESSAAPAKPSTPTATSQTKQRELIETKIENQRAQGGYYRAQTKEIEESKSFWRNVKANPVAVAAVLGAFATIFIGLLNYRQALRNQQDSQFYEAIGRFGDDSPALRSSAAGLLAQMGTKRSAYFETALDQLTAGLQLEEDPVVIDSIRKAIQHIVIMDPRYAARRIRDANLSLQGDLVCSLADFMAASVSSSEGAPSEDWWTDAAHASGYATCVLSALVNRPKYNTQFESRALSSPRLTTTSSADARETGLKEAADCLRMVSSRLRANVELLALVIRYFALPRLNLENTFLVGADLTDAQLPGAGLWHAQMQRAHCTRAQIQGAAAGGVQLHTACLKDTKLEGADLTFAELQGALLDETHLQKADLHGAKLKGARFLNAALEDTILCKAEIDEKTSMTSTDWWKADFGGDEKNERDSALLAELYRRYRKDLPEDPEEIHPSARNFITQKRREETEKPGSE
jgi:uncharacterized protein YjbI with pentapeptide repeats